MMTCRICPREDREQIDAMLLRGVTLRSIVEQHGKTSPPSLLRHKAHIPERLARAAALAAERGPKAHEAAEVAAAGQFLRKREALEARAARLLDDAERTGQLGPAAALLREMRELLKLFGEVSGELKMKTGGGVTVNVLNNPSFLVLQQRVVAALEDFPEARARVVAALADDASDA